eukprot:1139249-Pelagomonas_calceolata.AAC.6
MGLVNPECSRLWHPALAAHQYCTDSTDHFAAFLVQAPSAARARRLSGRLSGQMPTCVSMRAPILMCACAQGLTGLRPIPSAVALKLGSMDTRAHTHTHPCTCCHTHA